MHDVHALVLAALVAGANAKATNNGTPQGGLIEMLPRADHDGTCAELPKFCTAPVIMYGYATTVTYLCPATTTTHEPSTVHVTITKTTTVAPPSGAQPNGGSTGTHVVIAPSPTLTEEPDITTTIHSTLTKYKTITIVRSTNVPLETTPPIAASITDYLSATIPTELVPLVPETEEPVFTIQTSTTPAARSTSSSSFPTMSPPVFNGTTTGIFYTASVANSTLVQPTPFFPNTTSSRSHYALPTLNVENRAARDHKDVKGAAEKVTASFIALVFGVVAAAFAA